MKKAGMCGKKLECMAKASNTSQANPFLLFVGKEQTEKLYQEEHKSKAKKRKRKKGGLLLLKC